MKKKVYIETSVISYLVARLSNDIVTAGRQIVSQQFWDKREEYEGFCSVLVYVEAARGDADLARNRLERLSALEELQATEDAKEVMKTLLDKSLIPKEYADDALHIAIAAINGMDFLVSWNFKHINNPVTRKQIENTIESLGYEAPSICSPDEFLEAMI
jgi:hypothetical protein